MFKLNRWHPKLACDTSPLHHASQYQLSRHRFQMPSSWLFLYLQASSIPSMVNINMSDKATAQSLPLL
jgi:hypothetical protein